MYKYPKTWQAYGSFWDEICATWNLVDPSSKNHSQEVI